MFVSGADSTYNQIIGRVVLEGGEGMGKLYYQKLRNALLGILELFYTIIDVTIHLMVIMLSNPSA